MCKVLTNILRDEKGIRWSYKERYIRCMNHIINLAVQDFLKSIKGLSLEDKDENVDDSEESGDTNVIPPEGFALAMWNIRELTKVHFNVTYLIVNLRKFLLAMFVPNASKSVANSSSSLHCE